MVRPSEYTLGRLYISKDYGTTFNATGPNEAFWADLHISRLDGMTIAAVDTNGTLYRSRDYGDTFEVLPNLLSGTRGAVAISDDCTHWVVGKYRPLKTCDRCDV